MKAADSDLQAAQSGDGHAFERLVEPYRRELRALCYRMSGSLHDADELLQESLLRAWKGLNTFEGRASFRTWLYKVTTSVCLDALRTHKVRTLPSELGAPVNSVDSVGPPQLDPWWIEPCPENLYRDTVASSEALYIQRESVALAFLVALQLLPPKQRVVLILRDVVGLRAAECATLLDLSIEAVKSALQRARKTLDSRARAPDETPATIGEAKKRLLLRYMEAWETADCAALMALLREEVTLSMPPFREWLRGAVTVTDAIRRRVFEGPGRAGLKMVPTTANGVSAFAIYYRDPESHLFLPRGGLQLVETIGDRVSKITVFIGAIPVEEFGLPLSLPEDV